MRRKCSDDSKPQVSISQTIELFHKNISVGPEYIFVHVVNNCGINHPLLNVTLIYIKPV